MKLFRRLFGWTRRAKRRALVARYRKTAEVYRDMARYADEIKAKPIPWVCYCRLMEANYLMRADEQERVI